MDLRLNNYNNNLIVEIWPDMDSNIVTKEGAMGAVPIQHLLLNLLHNIMPLANYRLDIRILQTNSCFKRHIFYESPNLMYMQ